MIPNDVPRVAAWPGILNAMICTTGIKRQVQSLFIHNLPRKITLYAVYEHMMLIKGTAVKYEMC